MHGQTGKLRLNRWVGAFDTGRILNPKTALSRFRGGIIMGIGMALTEETMFDDRTGRIMNPTLAEHHLPVQADVPHIEVVYTETAAAIANAVYHATGKRVTSLPITLDKLL